MAKFLSRSFTSVDKRTVEISNRSLESEQDQATVDPSNWNPPALHATDIYKPEGGLSFLKKKLLLKEVELNVKISGPSTQIVSLPMFSEKDLQKFSQYVAENKYSYLHFGGSRIGLAPLFRQGIKTPCRAFYIFGCVSGQFIKTNLFRILY